MIPEKWSRIEMRVVAVKMWLENSADFAFNGVRGIRVYRNSGDLLRIPDISQRLNFVMNHYLAFGFHIQSELTLPE